MGAASWLALASDSTTVPSVEFVTPRTRPQPEPGSSVHSGEMDGRGAAAIAALSAAGCLAATSRAAGSGSASGGRPIEEAEEGLLDLGDGISLWYRTWGRRGGIPVLFVHGGPGNCVADYQDVNGRAPRPPTPPHPALS